MDFSCEIAKCSVRPKALMLEYILRPDAKTVSIQFLDKNLFEKWSRKMERIFEVSVQTSFVNSFGSDIFKSEHIVQTKVEEKDKPNICIKPIDTWTCEQVCEWLGYVQFNDDLYGTVVCFFLQQITIVGKLYRHG